MLQSLIGAEASNSEVIRARFEAVKPITSLEFEHINRATTQGNFREVFVDPILRWVTPGDTLVRLCTLAVGSLLCKRNSAKPSWNRSYDQ